MESTGERFLNYMSANYNAIKESMERYATAKMGGFDEDIFQSTILKVYEKIEKDGLKDDSDDGFLNYFFMSFKTNTHREKQYARNKKNDDNLEQENIEPAYEKWYNANYSSEKEKLISDLRKDYFALRLAEVVEKAFDSEHFYLWRLKTFMPYTYKQLQEKTKIPSARQKVLEVMDYLRANVRKEDLEEEFQKNFSDIIDF